MSRARTNPTTRSTTSEMPTVVTAAAVLALAGLGFGGALTLTAQEASSDPDRDALRDAAIAQQEAMLDVRAAGPEIRAVDPRLQSGLDSYVADRVVAEPSDLVAERSAEEPQPEPESEPEPEPEPEVTSADTEEETTPAPSVYQSGTASWYGPGFEGNTTANGETYDPSQLTAAHRELPFGTLVRVTNQNNGQSVTVRINDRGPYAGDRIIDLSEAAASQIGMRGSGVAPVTLEIVG